MASVWILVAAIIVVLAPAGSQGKRLLDSDLDLDDNIDRVALRPNSNSNLCVRIRNSALQLAPCGNGGQIFDKIKLNRNTIQLRVSSVRKEETDSCVITSFSPGTSDTDVSVDDDGDIDVDDSSTSNNDFGSPVITTSCSRRNTFQSWIVRKVEGGVQITNKRTKRCISASAISGTSLVTVRCRKSDRRQIWNVLTVKI